MDPMVLHALGAAATAWPHQRACQLIANAMDSVGVGEDHFYVEDAALIEALKAYAKRADQQHGGDPHV